jgi:pentalenolactone synthase
MAGAPIARVSAPSGDAAWRVTGYAEVKALLGDRRLGRAHPDPGTAAWYSKQDLAGRPAGRTEDEYALHGRWRAVMTRVFSPRRLLGLRTRTAELAAQLVDELEASAPPADLHARLSLPLPTLLLCELLGVPYTDSEDFQRWTEEGGETTDIARSAAGMAGLLRYVRSLTQRRRLQPGDDPVSELIAAGGDQGAPHDGRVAKLLAGILSFGRESPASAIDHGTLLLLTNPDQRAVLQRDPSLVAAAVEETLRLFPPAAASTGGLMRYAHVDMAVAGATVRAGDMVLLDVVAANRDERVFPGGDRFVITRDPNPHLTFGHGPYMCNFHLLARMELQVAFAELFRRFPGLRLAVPEERLRPRSHLRSGGLVDLPVAW